MAALSCQFHCTIRRLPPNPRIRPSFYGSVQPSQSNIKVVINGAAKEIGRAAEIAVTKTRGLKVAGALDSYFVGEDIGKATAFGLKSVVYVPQIKLDTATPLSEICEKACTGCLVAPTLSIGSILLQQAAISASFHYNNVEIVESTEHAKVCDETKYMYVILHVYFDNYLDLHNSKRHPYLVDDLLRMLKLSLMTGPSVTDAVQIAQKLSNLGQIYKREDLSTDALGRGRVLGEDEVCVHSMVLHGLPSSAKVYFSGPEEVYTTKHDITGVQCLMPGLILAIRKVVQLKHLVYGLEKN